MSKIMICVLLLFVISHSSSKKKPNNVKKDIFKSIKNLFRPSNEKAAAKLKKEQEKRATEYNKLMTKLDTYQPTKKTNPGCLNKPFYELNHKCKAFTKMIMIVFGRMNYNQIIEMVTDKSIPENPVLKVFVEQDKEIKRLKQLVQKEDKEYTKLYSTMDNEIKNKEEEMQNEIHDYDKDYTNLVDQYRNLENQNNEIIYEKNYAIQEADRRKLLHEMRFDKANAKKNAKIDRLESKLFDHQHPGIKNMTKIKNKIIPEKKPNTAQKFAQELNKFQGLDQLFNGQQSTIQTDTKNIDKTSKVKRSKLMKNKLVGLKNNGKYGAVENNTDIDLSAKDKSDTNSTDDSNSTSGDSKDLKPKNINHNIIYNYETKKVKKVTPKSKKFTKNDYKLTHDADVSAYVPHDDEYPGYNLLNL